MPNRVTRVDPKYLAMDKRLRAALEDAEQALTESFSPENKMRYFNAVMAYTLFHEECNPFLKCERGCGKSREQSA